MEFTNNVGLLVERDPLLELLFDFETDDEPKWIEWLRLLFSVEKSEKFDDELNFGDSVILLRVTVDLDKKVLKEGTLRDLDGFGVAWC